MNKELLNSIIKTASPSGFEDKLQLLLKDEYKEAEDFLVDYQGSLTAIYNKDVPFKVCLMAHADEISLIVTGYNNDGSLTVDRNGGISPKLYVGCKVRIITPDKVINGVMGKNSNILGKEKLSAEDLFVDLGCSNKEEAMKLVPLGSYIIHDTDMMELQNDLVAGRAFDDRLGVFIIQEAARKAYLEGSECGIYATATTGEETSGRGAYSSAALIKPDITVVVDVTYATDYQSSGACGDIVLGNGGVICKGSLPNRKLNDLLKECAVELNLPVQYEVFAGRTGTDGDTVCKANNGEPHVLFSIPLRYMHSPVEIASYKDINSMIEILSLFLKKINKDSDLKPF